LVNQQINASQRKLDHIQEMLRFANTRFREGATSSQDVINVRNNILEQEKRIVALQHERTILLNEHAVLKGTAPEKSAIEPAMLPEGNLPQINKNVPASVLMHRPDIKAKEMKLREALTNVDMSRADFYPSFNLTSSIGSGSTALFNLLQNPLGSVSANLTLPLLEWRKRRMDVKISRNSYEQQLLEYKQELYKAMSSIQNELSKHSQLLNKETLIRQQLELARQSERVSEVSYLQGAKPMSEWLNAQENRRDAELSLDQNRFNQLSNLADIYVAFGGSWTSPAILPD
jgi:outer membrane protein TolC